MSTFESSYRSLLQGVSQQIPSERQPGQATAQENMLSDIVTGPRRRPGAEYKFDKSMATATTDTVKAWFTDIAGQRVHVLVNTANGTVKVLNEAYAELASFSVGAYLTAARRDILATTVGDEFFLLNRTVTPTLGAADSGIDPKKAGFFYISSGAFSKKYEVTITSSLGSATASYTTPSGTNAGDAALATPDYIATQLVTGLGSPAGTTGLTVVRLGAYVYLYAAGAATAAVVESSTGIAYIVPSRAQYIATVGNLPAVLPTEADGFRMAVGDSRTPQYFKYQHSNRSWLESGAYGSPASIQNMPRVLTYNGSWTLTEPTYEGRLSGDAESNPTPFFVTAGITGLAAYQGRLVFLARGRVNMSAANNTRRFFRSTVTGIPDSDPIEVGSSANSSAAYEWAEPFQKDLILLSSAYQALIPSGNQAITPRTATVVLTGAQQVDTSASPVVLGRTLMFATPRSPDFFGTAEMLPSPYTDSQYVSTDSTPHLPKYMGGRCRFAASSPVANVGVFAPSGDKKSLIVHEYLWDGDTKVQKAWHRWTFPYDIAWAYFVNESIMVLFVRNNLVVGCTIDPRVGALSLSEARRPFLDLYVRGSITANVVAIPAWMLTFDPGIATKLKLAASTGALAGSDVGFTVNGSNLNTVLSWPSGNVAIGIPFRSSFSPTPPVIKDSNEVAISTGKQTLLRYTATLRNSAEFHATIADRYAFTAEADVGVLSWGDAELSPGSAQVSSKATVVVPCRTELGSTVVEFYTESAGELNLTALEYTAKYHAKVRRR